MGPRGTWKGNLRGLPGKVVKQRLAEAVLVEGSFCSVAGLELEPHGAVERRECCVGDALTMIPPVTGNGMSMAFEAGELASEPLVMYAKGICSWTEARERIAKDCDAAFKGRLAWARWLQWMMFAPLFRTRVARLILNSERIWELLFNRTR